MLTPHQIIIKPVISEKSYGEIEDSKYTFMVDLSANKIQIRKAIESLFDVAVVKVNTINVKSKPKRLGRSEGKTARWKKAIVTLKDGDKIEFFEGA